MKKYELILGTITFLGTIFTVLSIYYAFVTFISVFILSLIYMFMSKRQLIVSNKYNISFYVMFVLANLNIFLYIGGVYTISGLLFYILLTFIPSSLIYIFAIGYIEHSEPNNEG